MPVFNIVDSPVTFGLIRFWRRFFGSLFDYHDDHDHDKKILDRCERERLCFRVTTHY